MSGGGVSDPARLSRLVVLLVVRVLWLLILRLNPLGLERLLEERRRMASRPVGLSSSLSRRPIAMVIVVIGGGVVVVWCDDSLSLSLSLSLW